MSDVPDDAIFVYVAEAEPVGDVIPALARLLLQMPADDAADDAAATKRVESE